MIRGRYLNNKSDLTEVFRIRKEVFQIEQGVKKELERDYLDEVAVHVILYDENDKAVGTGRIVYDGDQYLIGRIAVLKEERKKGYGDFIVRMLMDKAFANGAEEVVVEAQVKAVPFYQSMGFRECGEEFEKENGRHMLMKIKKDEIVKKCGCKG